MEAAIKLKRFRCVNSTAADGVSITFTAAVAVDIVAVSTYTHKKGKRRVSIKRNFRYSMLEN